jgi:hypothetical protein
VLLSTIRRAPRFGVRGARSGEGDPVSLRGDMEER